jgi:hypothetical protein
MSNRIPDSHSRTLLVATRSIVLATLLQAASPPIVAAALAPSHGVGAVEADDLGSVELLAPSDLDRGLRLRIERMRTRRDSHRTLRREAPREYFVEDPPPDVDVPISPDAPGGEISNERLEEMR